MSVTWAPELGLLVAVSRTGTGDRVMTSPDGINWTTQSSAADIQWVSVTWAKELGLLVAVSNTGTGNRIMVSPDGIKWSLVVSPIDNAWTFVTWAEEIGVLVAVAISGTGNRVMTTIPYKQPTFSRPVWAINSLTTQIPATNNELAFCSLGSGTGIVRGSG
jgi:hypothetical protein